MDVTTRYFEACERGDVEAVSRFISQLEHIDIKNESGRTGLAVAVRFEHFDLARSLLQAGADIHATNMNGTTIFMYAKTPAFTSKNTDIMQWVLDQGADINAVDRYGLSVLDYVKKAQADWMIRWMQQRGARFAHEL